MRSSLALFALVALLSVVPVVPAVAQPETVDCDAGDSLQAAVVTSSSETPLEVFGVCNERIVIDHPITIVGGEPGATIDSSGFPGNTVTIESDSVFIRDIRITGAGESPTAEFGTTGNGVFDMGAHTFSLINVVVFGNDRAGILAYNSYITIVGSKFRGNGGAGIALVGGCCGILGVDRVVVRNNGSAGIYTDGDQTLVMTHSKVKGNVGSGVLANEDPYIADSVIRRNGGGVSSQGTGRLVRTRVVANDGWGISYVGESFDSVIARNAEGGIKCGGCDVAGSVVRRNGGPGIEEPGTVRNTSIVRNDGPGLIVGASGASFASVAGSLISGNAGTTAGAASVLDGSLELANSTVRRNTATTGAAFDVAGDLDLVNTTVFRNSGPDGVFSSTGTVNVQGSIVFGHLGAADHCTGGPIASGGHNVVTAPGCPWIGTDMVADPLLEPLADNGGPTRTHALSAGSPAIDAIPPAACAVSVDQRGDSRPVGAGCDSGAYEVQ